MEKILLLKAIVFGGLVTFASLGVAVLIFDFRRKAKRSPKRTSTQVDQPHSSIERTADEKTLQNGGTIGPGALGGGADFCPS